jgi:5S rRNA maturation endonuclease (ribonuclease M5)
MIQSRQSEDVLNKETILEKVSEYQIFQYFCSHFEEPNKKFKSDLREDNSPTVSITQYQGRLWYKDFGCPEHSFDCFSYIGFKYNLNFYDTLRHIDRNFSLGLSAGSNFRSPVRKLDKEIREKTPAKIKVRTKDWAKEDLDYWLQFGIPKEVLIIFDVLPITHYWINEQRFSCPSISYRYRFDCGYKIYRPLEKEFKWASNVGSQCLQGFRLLPRRHKVVYLTSSLKDVMCLRVLGFPAFALQSEMLMPLQETISEVKERFEEVIVLYDNDFDKSRNPGQEMAEKICREYNLTNLVIPSYYRSKDISDLVRDHGLEEARNVITRKSNRSKEISREDSQCET